MSSLTWADISRICPICDERMDQIPCYYGAAKCPNEHYELSSGNYHVDVFINGEWKVHFDEMDPPEVEENYKKFIAEARKQWQEGHK